MMLSVLPADTYIVINKSILNIEDNKIINMLYLPIVGTLPIMLYFTLVSDLDKLQIMGAERTHHHLVTNMQISMTEYIESRKKLEAIGLIKTYAKEGSTNTYVYELYSPLSASEFFSHPILNIVLYNNVGKKEYEELINYFKIPKITLSEYKDITCSFNEVFASVPLTSYEILNDDVRKKNKLKLNININFDFDFLISSIPNSLINEKAFTNDVKELILNLAYIYDIDAMHMANIIKGCINEKGSIAKEDLRKSCRNYYQFENVGLLPSVVYNTQPSFLKKPEGGNTNWDKMVYTFETVSPYDFLKSMTNGSEPTKRDLKLIEDIIIEYGLKPGVANVLAHYSLKTNNNKLNRNFLETIAGQWKRIKIETVEDAMQQVVKERNKGKTKNKQRTFTPREETLPEWFGKEIIKEEVTKEEEENLKELLKEFG